MPVSGLVLTFSGTPSQSREALNAIRLHGAFTPGELSGRWLPVAMEARDDAESRKWHDWLMSLPGVAYVDVVAVNFAGDPQDPDRSEDLALVEILR